MGISKISKKSKLAFEKITSILILVILCSAFFMAMKYAKFLSGEHMAQFCQDHFYEMIAMSSTATFVSLILIIYNSLLVDFYKDYSAAENKRKLLGNEMNEVDA